MFHNYHTKLVQNIVDSSPKTVISLIVLSLIFIISFKDFVPSTFLYGWTLMQSVFIYLRYFNAKLLKKHLQNSDTKKIKFQLNVLAALVTFSAIIWNVGAIGGALYAGHYFELFSFIVVLGLITAGTMSLSPTFNIYVAYYFFLLIPQLLFLYQFDDALHKSVLMLALIYVPYILMLSQSIHKNLLQTIHEHENFKYLFNHTAETIFMFQENRCVDVNEAGCHLFAFNDKSSVLEKSPLEFIAKESHELFLKNLTDTSSSSFQAIARKYNGENFYVILKIQIASLSGVQTTIISMIDISELKEKEIQLELAKEKAVESVKMKSHFLANMSHEIRTPMNAIIGMTYLVKKSILDKKQMQYLERIEKSSKSLLNIINDILDFSKIESGKLNLDAIDFDMREVLQNVQYILEQQATEKGLKLNFMYAAHDFIFYGDSLRIGQILINIANNAIKFTKEGTVTITLQSMPKNKIRFRVKDTGIGISPAQQLKLFESFSQADSSTTRNYGGTGLGLSISKQLIELMGGKIWLESEVGVGSEFIFELILAPGDEKNILCEPITLPHDIKNLQGAKILLVEDNTTNQEIILGLLEESGIIIDIANNGLEAIEKFQTNKYELILMDLQMPLMDGYEATKIIRATDKQIPIIALTANAMKEDVERTKTAGMNEHLNKPIDVEKLYATLLKYISPKKSAHDNTIAIQERLELPEFKSIDTTLGLKHMAGNKKLYSKILGDFLNNYKNFSFENLNEEAFSRAAHTLKGLSANIGATALHSVVKELDETHNKELLNVCHEQLQKVLHELKEKLEPHEQNNKEEEKLELSEQKRAELHTKLLKVVATKRPKECQEVLDEIQKYKLRAQDEKLFEQVQLLVKKYRYKEILELLS